MNIHSKAIVVGFLSIFLTQCTGFGGFFSGIFTPSKEGTTIELSNKDGEKIVLTELMMAQFDYGYTAVSAPKVTITNYDGESLEIKWPKDVINFTPKGEKFVVTRKQSGINYDMQVELKYVNMKVIDEDDVYSPDTSGCTAAQLRYAVCGGARYSHTVYTYSANPQVEINFVKDGVTVGNVLLYSSEIKEFDSEKKFD